MPGYIDEGISGGTTKKRDDFNRMIADAKAGRFDFIITKEISRFFRSTLDSDSEFRLVVMAGVARKEIRQSME